MASFFGGFQFSRNFFSHSGWRASFRKLRVGKISLPRIFGGQLLSAVFLTFLGAFTFSNAACASPPTHYVSGTNGFSPYNFTGLSPEIAAQEYIAYVNSRLEMGQRLVATGSCHVVVYGSELGLYICPYRYTYPQGQYTDYSLDVYTRCGPQAQALWNGSEFYCPPTPECDAPVQR